MRALLFGRRRGELSGSGQWAPGARGLIRSGRQQLWYGSYAGQPALSRTGWGPGKSVDVKLPPLTEDAIAYIAQNPANRGEYAIATFGRSVFLSPDRGATWRQIADRGRRL